VGWGNLMENLFAQRERDHLPPVQLSAHSILNEFFYPSIHPPTHPDAKWTTLDLTILYKHKPFHPLQNGLV
jgi:hypothetical protein